MPELPEVEVVRRELEPALVGSTFRRIELRRRNLRRPFQHGFAARLLGATVLRVGRRGKFLTVDLTSGDVLIMHLGMSGSFRIALPEASGGDTISDVTHDHVVFTMSSGVVITYNDPRRFGSMDLARQNSTQRHKALGRMGPEPLTPHFNGTVLARACAGKRTSIKAALLDQRVVAGVGNIYASEALHRAGISPRRRASSLATASSRPRVTAARLAAAIQAVLRQAIAWHVSERYRSARFRVYEREGLPCLRRGCGGTIRRMAQAGRSTYFCPRCQR